jgi:hypothetical protein
MLFSPQIRLRSPDDLLNRLDADGVTPKLDILRVYATKNSTTALLNLISNSFNGTAHGSLTFTADSGFTTQRESHRAGPDTT